MTQRRAAWDKRYRERNLEKIIAKQREYRRLNREELNRKKREAGPGPNRKQVVARYAQTPKGKATHAAIMNRRRARLAGSIVEPYSRRLVYERDEGLCGICGKAVDWTLHGWDPDAFTIDHLTPIAKGGTDTLDNVRSAHRRCNTKRGVARGVVIVKRRKKVLVNG